MLQHSLSIGPDDLQNLLFQDGWPTWGVDHCSAFGTCDIMVWDLAFFEDLSELWPDSQKAEQTPQRDLWRGGQFLKSHAMNACFWEYIEIALELLVIKRCFYDSFSQVC